MKESEGPADVVFEFRGYRLDPGKRRLTDPRGRRVRLPVRVFDTLCLLVRRAGETVSKAELMDGVWPGAVVEENNLNQAISTLRRTFGDDRRNPAFIATITGRGYQFVAEVSSAANENAGGPEPDQRGGRSRLATGAGLALAAAALAAIVVLAVKVFTPASGPVEVPVISLDSARLVTPFEGSHSEPTLSPDGTLMAYVSNRSGMPQLWVQGLPDGKPIQITDGDAPARSPSWSPVDDAILFERPMADGTPAVWLVDALGTGEPRVIMRDARHPRFAPDGNTFVFRRGLKSIHVATVEGTTVRTLEGVPDTPGFAEPMPAINAAGDIAFVLADGGPVGDLWLYRASDDSFHRLTRPTTDFPGVLARSPVWLPDGRSILYAAAPEDALNFHLWLADAETGDTERISTGVGGYDEPAVSRDGALLAYSHARPLWRLVATDTSTGKSRTIYESRTPIVLPLVSPDGGSVVWFADHVYTVPVAGGEAEQQTYGPTGEATLPTWSRDGAVIYFYNGRSLDRLDTATGLSEAVLEDFHWSSRNWLSVHGDKLVYQERTGTPRGERTVLDDLATGERRELETAVLPTEWTRDGTAFLARRKSDSAIVICRAPDFACSPVRQDGAPVQGAMPHWSSDESRIFFRRLRQDKPGYAEIWVIPRDGGEAKAVVEIGPFETRGMSFGVTSDDAIVWPQYDTRGLSEIWMVDLTDKSAGAADK